MGNVQSCALELGDIVAGSESGQIDIGSPERNATWRISPPSIYPTWHRPISERADANYIPNPTNERLVLAAESRSFGRLVLVGTMNIGSGVHNDFIISHPSVSSTHAIIEDRCLSALVDDMRMIRDGIEFPKADDTEKALGERIDESAYLREKLCLGDVIFFGEVKFLVVAPQPSDAESDWSSISPRTDKRVAMSHLLSESCFSKKDNNITPSRSPRRLPGLACVGASITPPRVGRTSASGAHPIVRRVPRMQSLEDGKWSPRAVSFEKWSA